MAIASDSADSSDEWEKETREELEAIQRTPQPIEEAANQFVTWLRGPRRDAARVVAQLNDQLGRWIDRYFLRQGVPESEAEELTGQVWIRLLSIQSEDKGNGFALLCRVRRSVFIDYVRARRAEKRTGGTIAGDTGASEVYGDEDFWDVLSDTAEAPGPPADLEDCVQRKFAIFRSVAPARASLLEMITLGLSYKEIASSLFDIPEDDVTQQQVARVRNRIEEARKQAEPFFRECED